MATSSTRRRSAIGSSVAFVLACVIALLCASPVRGQVPGETIEYYAHDAVGSVRVVFNTAGAVVGRGDYLPFGEEFPNTGLPAERFTGQPRDAESSLDYFRARNYQFRHGRFVQPDPVFAGLFDPQAWNRYAYALNEPLTFTDPSGLCSGVAYTTNSNSAGGSKEYTCTENVTVTAKAPPAIPLVQLPLIIPSHLIDTSYNHGFHGPPTSATSGSPGGGSVEQSRTEVLEDILHPCSVVLGCKFGPVSEAGLPKIPTPVALALIDRVSKGVKAASPFVKAGIDEAKHAAAKIDYPKLIDKLQLHHIIPRYLGGPLRGAKELLAELPGPYHQLITNEFRKAFAYGSKIQPTLAELEKKMIEIYTKYPLP